MQKSTVEALRSARVTGSDLDWVTVTTTTRDSSERLWSLGRSLLDSADAEGERTTRWHAHGYEGWASNGCALGSRADGCILRLSNLKSRDKGLEAIMAGDNCTRLDLAVDTQFQTPVTTLAHQLYVEDSGKKRHAGKPPMRKLVMDTNGGSTCYFGSRTSERFGRVYDKGRETGTLPAGLWWRWELELKQTWASTMGGALVSAADHRRVVASEAADFFRERVGVAPTVSAEPIVRNEARHTSTDDRLLLWLAVGVRPTVQRLTDRYGPERILHALGFPLRSAVNDPTRPGTPERCDRCQQ